VAGSATDQVVAVTAVQHVVARTAIEIVIAVAATDQGIAVAAGDEVVARAGIDHQVALDADGGQDVVAIAKADFAIDLRAFQQAHPVVAVAHVDGDTILADDGAGVDESVVAALHVDAVEDDAVIDQRVIAVAITAALSG